MGIKDLHRWIRKNHPSTISRVLLSSFSGRRIAVDATNVCYEIWSSAFRGALKSTDVISREVDREEVAGKCLQKLRNYLRNILSCGVLPVFVFDGEYHKDKALYAQRKRRETRSRARHRLNTLDDEIASIHHPPDRNRFLEEKRKVLAQTEGPELEIETMKNVLFASGIPCIQAYYEAEKLCSQLCYEGRVDAVISADSDNLAHGCLMLLTRLEIDKDGELVAEAFSLPLLLESMNLTFESFIDFCILCGCDYNENMRGVGIVRAFDLIRVYGKIENFPLTHRNRSLDKSVLNYSTCRKIFALAPSPSLAEKIVLDPRDPDRNTLKDLDFPWDDDMDRLLRSLPPILSQRIITRL